MTRYLHDPVAGQRARMRRRFRDSALLPLVLALSALVISVLIATGGNIFPASKPSAPPGTVAASHAVRYEVTGTPGATASISFVTTANGAMTKAPNQPLPWTTDVQVRPGSAPFVQVTVLVVRDAEPAGQQPAVTNCKITVDGRTVAENHTTSAAKTGYVDCDAVVR